MSDPAELFTLTAHAAQVLEEREIALEWVELTLREPYRNESDRTDPDVRHALRAIPEFGGRVLRVVYDGTAQPWRVITAFFDRSQRMN